MLWYGIFQKWFIVIQQFLVTYFTNIITQYKKIKKHIDNTKNKKKEEKKKKKKKETAKIRKAGIMA